MTTPSEANTPQVVQLPQLATVPDVEIVAAGTWPLSTGDATFTAADLAAAVQASQCPAVGRPVIKLGHTDPRFDGEPAVGSVANMRLTCDGTKISGDLAGMPAWLAAALPSAYPNRSIEGMYGYQCQIGHNHPFVLTGVALLGVAAPGVGVLSSLKDVAALYGVAATSGGEASTWTLRLGEAMAGSSTSNSTPPPNPATTVEDIRRAYYDDPATPVTYWITEIQLSPLQMIVADEAAGNLYRIPVTIGSDNSVTFGTPVPVAVTYVDSPQAQTAAASAGVGRGLAIAAKRGDESLRAGQVAAAWDASAEIKNLGTDPTQAQINAMFALPADTKSNSKLPHHDVGSDGTVGAADVDGVEAALAAINGAQGGLSGVSADDVQKAYDHLAAHYKAAGKTPPPLKTSAAGTAPDCPACGGTGKSRNGDGTFGSDCPDCDGTGKTPVTSAAGGLPDPATPAPDQQNPAGEGPADSGPVEGQCPDCKGSGRDRQGDGTFSGTCQTCQGSGKDPASGKAAKGGGNAATASATVSAAAGSSGNTEEADMQFSTDQQAQLRAKLGLAEDAELTPDMILAALTAPGDVTASGQAPGGGSTAKPEADPAKPGTGGDGQQVQAAANGLVMVDPAVLTELRQNARLGAEARQEQRVAYRDGVIAAAIKAGKTPPARREHWEKGWEVDPEGTEQVLASLEPGLIPLVDLGTPGGEAPTEQRDFAEYNTLFGPPKAAR